MTARGSKQEISDEYDDHSRGTYGRPQGDGSTRHYNPWLALVVQSAGLFTILLDITIVNIAIDSILRSGLFAR